MHVHWKDMKHLLITSLHQSGGSNVHQAGGSNEHQEIFVVPHIKYTTSKQSASSTTDANPNPMYASKQLN